MKKGSMLFLLLLGGLIYSCGSNGQSSNFEIDGTINLDSGTIDLVFYSDYLPDEAEKITAEIKNGKFSFSGYIPESQGVFMVVEDHYQSSDFVIDQGLQTISIDINLSREVPIVKNKTMLEYPEYKAFKEEIDTKFDLLYRKTDSLYSLYDGKLPDSIGLILNNERNALYYSSDSTLLKYAERNPDSKIAFWTLARLVKWGYEPILDSVYHSFSETMRNGYAGKVLHHKLQNGNQLSIGQMFPLFNCRNAKEESWSSHIFLRNKFTLVDFWYTGCGPCRRQFPALKDLYQEYHGKGFEIVAISVDRIEDKEVWEEVIAEEQLVWKQYWDKNGVETKGYSIHVFPTNFLINSTGQIIDKNITLEALSGLLKSSL